MTSDEFRTACILDARTAYGAYENMQTVELLRWQMELQVNAATAITPEEIAFGGGRLALIAAVLKKRGGETKPRPADRPAGSTAYYAHLDTCRQCREYPFDQCATGAALLRAAADASDRP